MQNSPKITLRQQEIEGGKKVSLYLDFYPPILHPKTGKTTRRRFLKLYAWANPKNKEEKAHNKNVYDQATLLRMEAEQELERVASPRLAKQEKKVLDFFDEVGKTLSCKTAFTHLHMQKYFYRFLHERGNTDITFGTLTLEVCKLFREFLLNAKFNMRSRKQALATNSRFLYFARFKYTLRAAFEQEFLQENFLDRLKNLPTTDTTREFLTLDELKTLAQTPCPNEALKKAALFSALTGLRFSDIEKMTWAEVREDGDKYSLHFRQQKTQQIVVHPIGRQAFQLLGERQADSEQVFPTLTYSTMTNYHVAHWVKLAGITKKITFHCFRHTFATLQLEAGTDIYTVSKLLGHTNIQTTQIYAKVVDKSKRDAAERINLDL